MSQSQEFTMQPVARIRSEFAEKFGVPRQSGLVEELEAEIVFEPAYRNPDALRGLEEFSHVWLIWVFDRAVRETWSPTVRPPRLGGNARMGVFATRSPFRPNPIALSYGRLCVCPGGGDAGGRHSAGAAGADPASAPGGAAGRAGAGPPPPLPERPGADLRVPLCGNGSPFFCGRNPADRPGHPENPLTYLPAGCFCKKIACLCIFSLTLINIVIR